MNKPATTLLTILLMIFLVEGGLMLFFHLADFGNDLSVILMDALFLPLLLTPALYFFAYRPLLKSTRKLEDALKEIKTLKGIIPICAYCKKIRDDEEIWQQIEDYLAENSEAQFTHGMCPDCYAEQVAKVHRMKEEYGGQER